ncbi:hypothetical protein [Blastococcus sp. SYSU D00820]
MATPYAGVGGVDEDLASHADEVTRSRLPLLPTVEGVRFWLDVDASGALLGVTAPEDGAAPTAVPGYWGSAVTPVVCRDLVVDPENFWRSRLVAEVVVPGAPQPGPAVVAAPVDLAHAGPGGYRRDSAARLRLSLAAGELTVHPDGEGPEPGLDCPGDRADAVLTGRVARAARRTSARTGREFAVLTVETAGLVLDVVTDAAEVPEPGTTVTATGRLGAVFAGPVAGLADTPGAPSLVTTARPKPVRRAPVRLQQLPGATDWPATTPLLELAEDAQVLAPVVSSAGGTDRGVIACCADWDGRWQLRRFPPGATAPDAAVDLPGHPAALAVHRGGVAAVIGRDLLVLDADLRILHRSALPPQGRIDVVASPAAVHVLLTDAAGGDAPDEAGRRALAAGAAVYRYRLHRLDLARLAAGAPDAWLSTDLPVSGIAARAPGTEPIWVDPGPADATGGGFWLAVPGGDPWGRPAQHHLVVRADGSLGLTTEVTGPPWTEARLEHGGAVLTVDERGPAVDGEPVPQPAPSHVRLLTGAVPGAAASRFDGQGAQVYELRGDGRPRLDLVAAAPESGHVTRAVDPGTGDRWYALSGAREPGVLGVVRGDGVLQPVLQAAEQFSVVAHAADSAVLTTTMASSPLLDERTGALLPPGQYEQGSYRVLATLVQVATVTR